MWKHKPQQLGYNTLISAVIHKSIHIYNTAVCDTNTIPGDWRPERQHHLSAAMAALFWSRKHDNSSHTTLATSHQGLAVTPAPAQPRTTSLITYHDSSTASSTYLAPASYLHPCGWTGHFSGIYCSKTVKYLLPTWELNLWLGKSKTEYFPLVLSITVSCVTILEPKMLVPERVSWIQRPGW